MMLHFKFLVFFLHQMLPLSKFGSVNMGQTFESTLISAKF